MYKIYILKTGSLDNAIQDSRPFIGLTIMAYEPLYNKLSSARTLTGSQL